MMIGSSSTSNNNDLLNVTNKMDDIGNSSNTENEATEDAKSSNIDPTLPASITFPSSVDGPFPTSSEPGLTQARATSPITSAADTSTPIVTPTDTDNSAAATTASSTDINNISPTEDLSTGTGTTKSSPTSVPTGSLGSSIIASSRYLGSMSSTPTQTNAIEDNTIYFAPNTGKNHTGVIVGSVVGSVVGLVVLGAFFTWLRRRGLKRNKQTVNNKNQFFFDSQDNGYDTDTGPPPSPPVSPLSPTANTRVDPETSAKLPFESPRRLVPPTTYSDIGVHDIGNHVPHQVLDENPHIPSSNDPRFLHSTETTPSRNTDKYQVNGSDSGNLALKPNCLVSDVNEKQLVEEVEEQYILQKPNAVD
ncbi:hypothetical protein J3Q64DRAFT_1700763 [Phycomyces blakesleeanus]|uniref:Mid2 domain-containing protein n=1 Tax=Phycomyces blakesleeanus TaxID=4837 RepID=A0ABR3AT50_PHYBL